MTGADVRPGTAGTHGDDWSAASGKIVLVTATALAEPGCEMLTRAGADLRFLDRPADIAGLERRLRSDRVDAVISRTLPLRGEAIRSCPTLRVIVKHGVGISNIDIDAASAAAIPVLTTPGTNSQSVAELTIALMLAAARRVSFLDREIHQGRWIRAQDGRQLSGRTLGLVGFGDIGRRVARIAAAIGMRVLAYDPALPGEARIDHAEMRPDVHSLLREASVLSVHVPLTPRTAGLLDGAALDLLPESAIVVNTARGGIIDEAALAWRVATGRLFAAALDTVADEPLAMDSPLRGMDRIVITPHVGGSTEAALAETAAAAARAVLAFFADPAAAAAAAVNTGNLGTGSSEVAR